MKGQRGKQGYEVGEADRKVGTREKEVGVSE